MPRVTIPSSKPDTDVTISENRIECLGQVVPISAIEKKIEFLERAKETEATMGCMPVTLDELKQVREKYYEINPK